MILIEISDNEEKIVQQAIEWIAEQLSTSAISENKSKELQFSLFKRTVIDKNGIAVSLTSKEFDLLYFLYLHKGQVFTKEQLYENVWGFEDMPKDTSNLPSFIRKLRKKIEPDPDNPIYIITVWGVGYKFSEEKP
ncbi:winged helix family transcriptional regulator [Clostridioides difficile]|uniref:Winged helix-turn-helix domain-containing protein n=2 Tax=Bacillota TaxID=1239 RepID=A0A7G9GTW3_9FIRM|nr:MULTISPECIES: helix-turn-helix domain-containing protein [Clostridia]KUE92209.1 transcriptional regulator [Streptococcus gallolyticus]QNM14245.1 winged helix-turn-helix domain-containing protein [[Eubacterium] hominis]RGC87596.1 winged helix family transcriptional regulator [Thomasclavelia ramosa]RGE59977.1 winged helix family transcriptional regulator [Sellimonas intestinalis]HAP8606306.1 winged helix-turn-helix domain-containing protein [Enterococcus faecium]